MLKRCRNLPRAGVGLFGLALVLMFALTAEAASLHGKGGMLFGGFSAGADPATSQPAVVTPPTVLEFSIAGSGNVNYFAPTAHCTAAGLVCNSGETCQCVETTGNVTDGVGPLFRGSLSFLLNVVTSAARQYPNGNNAGKVCFFASGVAMVTTFPGSTLNFVTSGAACNGTSGGAALYSGGFEIAPSTGGFVNAVGGGLLGFGSNINNGVGIFDLRGAGANIN